MADIQHFPSAQMPRFSMLWRMFLGVQELGLKPLPTRRNLAFFDRLFDAYYLGEADGICLTDADCKSVLLWGDGLQPPAIETNLGRIATGWGVFVHPQARGQGLSVALRQAGYPLLKERGFDCVIGTAHVGNEAGLKSALASGLEHFGNEVIYRL